MSRFGGAKRIGRERDFDVASLRTAAVDGIAAFDATRAEKTTQSKSTPRGRRRQVSFTLAHDELIAALAAKQRRHFNRTLDGILEEYFGGKSK